MVKQVILQRWEAVERWLTKANDEDVSCINRYFCTAWLLAFVYAVLRYPKLSYHAELWAEQGADFLETVMHLPLSEGIWVTGAGYLHTLPRVVSYLAYTFFPLAWFPAVTSLTGLAVVSFCAAVFNLRGFRSIVSSDRLRFAVTLLLGLIFFPNFYNYTYVNFSYHGMVLCFLMFFYDMRRLNVGAYAAISILMALLCASKFHFVLLLPFFLVSIAWNIRERTYRDAVAFLPPLIAIVVQIVAVHNIVQTDAFIRNGTVANAGSVAIAQHLFYGFTEYVQLYANLFPFFLAAMVCALVWYVLYRLYVRRILTRRQLAFILTGQLVAIAFAMVSGLHGGTPLHFFLPNWMKVDRRHVVSIAIIGVSLWGTWWALLHCHGLLPHRQKLVCKLLLVFCLWASFVSVNRSHNDYGEPRSSWQEYHALLLRDSYYIPCDPGPGGDNLTMLPADNVLHDCRFLKKYTQATGASVDIRGAMSDAQELQVAYLDVAQPGKVAIRAYDDAGSLLGEGRMISRPERRLKYVLFDTPVMHPARLDVTDADGQPLSMPYDVLLVGK